MKTLKVKDILPIIDNADFQDINGDFLFCKEKDITTSPVIRHFENHDIIKIDSWNDEDTLLITLNKGW